jgi:hypothetical protein
MPTRRSPLVSAPGPTSGTPQAGGSRRSLQAPERCSPRRAATRSGLPNQARARDQAHDGPPQPAPDPGGIAIPTARERDPSCAPATDDPTQIRRSHRRRDLVEDDRRRDGHPRRRDTRRLHHTRPGPSPVDRRKQGLKRSVLVDDGGIPWAGSWPERTGPTPRCSMPPSTGSTRSGRTGRGCFRPPGVVGDRLPAIARSPAPTRATVH